MYLSSCVTFCVLWMFQWNRGLVNFGKENDIIILSLCVSIDIKHIWRTFSKKYSYFFVGEGMVELKAYHCVLIFSLKKIF